jgi:CDP-4-dehydro-6-deoxyglucose reductase, E1
MKFRPITDRIEYGGAILGLEEITALFKVVLNNGSKRWTIGPESVALEKELAEVAGVKRAVLTNSGSSALLVAITALHLPKGTKVIIPACNFPTAFNSLIQNNLIPVVVDIDLKSLNLDLEEVKKAVKKYPSIEAVVAVDIAGNPVDLVKLREIVGKRIIILDDCDGFGTLLNGKMIEQYADVSCVSFHAAHIITMGEGGAVLTNNEMLADRATKIREWGRESGSDKIYRYEGFPNDYKERYVYTEIGYNVKPLELQCAMGRVQLKRLKEFASKRLDNYNKLKEIFKKYPRFTVIEAIENSTPCWFSFPVMVKYNGGRGAAMRRFEKNNIETRTIFSGNILRHPAYKDVKVIRIGRYPNADKVMKEGMFLSVHPSIDDDMIAFIDKVASEV